MRILHVITGLDVGGAETMLYRLATRMDMSRFQSRVVSLIEPGTMGRKLVDAGIHVDTLGMERGTPSLSGLLKLVRLMRSWRPDVVQTWLYHADLAGLVATRIAFPLGGAPKVVWNIRCSYMALEEYRRLTGVTLKVCARLSRFPDMVLTNSYDARRFHAELGYTPKRFDVIPNGFDTDHFKPDSEARKAILDELSIDPDATIVGHVARFDAMKDHRTFIRAAALAAQRIDGAVFMLVGRGVDANNDDIAAWMAEAGLAPERVRLLGERPDMSRIMAAMDVHVSSSVGESFPNVVGEAMACGVPNVVTDVGDSAILVGGTGLTVQPAMPDELADAIVSLTTVDDKRTRETARRRIVEHYSLPKMVASFADMYDAMYNGAL